MNPRILKAVIDRIEGDKTVLEVGGTYELILPLALLPEGIEAGNILEISISVNPYAEKRQREKIRNLIKKIKNT